MRRGFTFIELMVVIGIIALLAAILLPMANRARAMARRISMQSDLQAIVIAIDAYKHDFGDIPRPDGNVAGPFQGSCILVWSLIAPGPANGVSPRKTRSVLTFDGADGPGFRIRGTAGQVFGPYLATDHFRLGVLGNPTSLATAIQVLPPPTGFFDDSATFLGDSYGNAILYWPRKLKVNITDMNHYLAKLNRTDPAAYIADDNDPGIALGAASLDPGAITKFQLRLPGVVPSGSTAILPDPSQALQQPYILWSAGPDGRFCTDDDVTNFTN
jgi:prepilin-type N-terminal cleavage/methylation domain-containing protein